MTGRRKMPKARSKIMSNYFHDFVKFSLIFLGSLFGMFFYHNIFLDNPYNFVLALHLTTGVIFSVYMIFLVLKANSRNLALYMASLFMIIYALTIDNNLIFLVKIMVLLSAIYEIIIRFAIGVEIKLKFKELSWHPGKKKK